MTSVSIETPDLRFGTPAEIFQVTWDRGSLEALSRAYDYDAVGKRFLMARLAGEPDAGQINVVLNWTGELTQRVPVDSHAVPRFARYLAPVSASSARAPARMPSIA